MSWRGSGGGGGAFGDKKYGSSPRQVPVLGTRKIDDFDDNGMIV